MTFPNGNGRLECIDPKAGSGKRLGAVRCGHDDYHGGFGQLDHPDPMDHRQTPNRWPTTANLGGEFDESVRGLLCVNLVFETLHTIVFFVVVADGPAERNDSTAPRKHRPFQHVGDRERFAGDAEPVITARWRR